MIGLLKRVVELWPVEALDRFRQVEAQGHDYCGEFFGYAKWVADPNRDSRWNRSGNDDEALSEELHLRTRDAVRADLRLRPIRMCRAVFEIHRRPRSDPEMTRFIVV